MELSPATPIAERKLPGALIALAILNFLFAPLSLAAAAMTYGVATMSLFGERRPTLTESAHPTLYSLAIAAGIAIAVLLVASGVGYLLRKRLLGYTLGIAMCVVALITATTAVVVGPSLLGTIAMLCATYPIVSLVLLGRHRAHLTR
jgi:hypothetical protein